MDESQSIQQALAAPRPFSRRGFLHGSGPGVWAFHCHVLTHAEGRGGMLGMVNALIVE